jgi:hypothetical protein
VIAFLEVIAFHTTHVRDYLAYRISGGPSASMAGASDITMTPLMGITPEKFFTSPGLWGGLLVAALFLTGAAQLRRYRAPS